MQHCMCENLRSATRRLTRRYDAALAPSGLTVSQFSMLNYIAAEPGCGVATLADQLDLEISTATRNLRPLQEGGLVTMRTDPKDARRREVRLTAKGMRALARATTLWADVNRKTKAELGKDQSRDLLALLQTVRERILETA